MDRKEIARLFEQYKTGERVRAALAILDAATLYEVEEGALGTIEDPCVHGVRAVVRVRWDAGFSFVTSTQCLEPVGRPPAPGPKPETDEAKSPYPGNRHGAGTAGLEILRMLERPKRHNLH